MLLANTRMAPKVSLRIAATVALAVGAVVFAMETQAGRAVGAEDPAECPLRFDAHTVGLPKTCLFVGRYNSSCGQSAVAIFAGNGDTVVVGLAFDRSGSTTYLAGDVQSHTSANLAVWQKSPQVLAVSSVSGAMTLEDGGKVLRVRLAESPFRVEGCEFGEFVGRFVEMVDAGDALPPEDNRALRAAVDGPAT